MADSSAALTPTPKAKRQRSPAYPGINLITAIRRAEEFYQHEKRNPASFAVAAGHWNYKPTTSGALITVAALKSFGLMNEQDGGAGGRIIQLSDLGARIVMDKRPVSEERSHAIKEAALRPKIHAALWKKYNGNLPSDPELQHRLLWDWKFNENSIPDFIQEFKDTIAFAKLSESDTISTSGDDKTEVNVGNYVQWEPQGVLQFKEPRRVRAISDDGEWLFVDGSETGIPVKEITVMDTPEIEKPEVKPPVPPTLPLNSPRIYRMDQLTGGSRAERREDIFSLAEGTVTIQWPASLSKESYQDLSDWLDILKRKIGRSVEPKKSHRVSSAPEDADHGPESEN